MKIYWIIIAALIAVIIMQRACIKCPKCAEGEIKNDTILKYDSIIHTITINKPIPYNVEVPVNIPSITDTEAILRDYFSYYFYAQTISDSNITTTISDTISQNKITGRGFQYQILKPQTIITNTTTINDKKKNKLYIGIQLNGDGKNSFGVVPQLAFQSKRSDIYHLGYDVLNQDIQFGFFYKIKLSKK